MITFEIQNHPQFPDIKHFQTCTPNSRLNKHFNSRTPTFNQYKSSSHKSHFNHHTGPSKPLHKDGLLPSPNTMHGMYSPLTPTNNFHTPTNSDMNRSSSPAMLAVQLQYSANEFSSLNCDITPTLANYSANPKNLHTNPRSYNTPLLVPTQTNFVMHSYLPSQPMSIPKITSLNGLSHVTNSKTVLGLFSKSSDYNQPPTSNSISKSLIPDFEDSKTQRCLSDSSDECRPGSSTSSLDSKHSVLDLASIDSGYDTTSADMPSPVDCTFPIHQLSDTTGSFSTDSSLQYIDCDAIKSTGSSHLSIQPPNSLSRCSSTSDSGYSTTSSISSTISTTNSSSSCSSSNSSSPEPEYPEEDILVINYSAANTNSLPPRQQYTNSAQYNRFSLLNKSSSYNMQTALYSNTQQDYYTRPRYNNYNSNGYNKHHNNSQNRRNTRTCNHNQFNNNNSNNNISNFTTAIVLYSVNTKESSGILESKNNYCNRLNDLCTPSFKGARFYIVGSSMNGFSTQDSDLDLCMITHLPTPRWIDSVYILKQLYQTLHEIGVIEDLVLIQAKTPIIKFKDRQGGYDVDISVNNQHGIRNTYLLRAYSQLDSRVRPLVVLIKQWAKVKMICNARLGMLSSYSITLMVIFYLQNNCSPPVLPPLQTLYPNIFGDHIDIESLAKFDTSTLKYSSLNQQTHTELLIDFFAFYSNFDFNQDIMSVRTGGIVRGGGYDYIGFIKLEEPYTRQNVARSVSRYDNFQLIVQEIQNTHSLLKQAEHNIKLSDLLTPAPATSHNQNYYSH